MQWSKRSNLAIIRILNVNYHRVNASHILPLWQISAKTSPMQFFLFEQIEKIFLKITKYNFEIVISKPALLALIHHDFSVPCTRFFGHILISPQNFRQLMTTWNLSVHNQTWKVNWVVCLQAFPSFQSPSFLFLALTPFFTQAKLRKSCSSDFICYPTPWKRLLRRLHVCTLQATDCWLQSLNFRLWNADCGPQTADQS